MDLSKKQDLLRSGNKEIHYNIVANKLFLQQNH